MKILPQKLPGTQDLALMVIYANTDDHSESRYKGHNECCGAQLSELMEMYMFGKTLHPRSVYYPITCLCIDRLIEKSNEDSDHESHLLGHGKRTFYRVNFRCQLTPKVGQFCMLINKLGQMVAKAGSEDIETLSQAYIDLSMQLLKKQPNRKRHTNTLQHIMGYLRKDIDKTDKQELLDSIMAYQRGEVPLVMPLTLLKHHFTKHPNDYISMQRYLSPFPVELRW